eukprot:COSAG02_NODE_38583_length_427_cov_1.033537_1_plen_56_part_01
MSLAAAALCAGVRWSSLRIVRGNPAAIVGSRKDFTAGGAGAAEDGASGGGGAVHRD